MKPLTDAEMAAYDQAQSYTRQTVRRLLRALHGDKAVTQRPIGNTDITTDEPADWVAGADAARRVRNYAEGEMFECARKARAEGVSWKALAPALGVPEGHEAPAEAAFEVLAPVNEAHSWDLRTVSWRCASCGQMITDQGPYESHPDDNERGHAENCTRHAVDIAAWKRRVGWED